MSGYIVQRHIVSALAPHPRWTPQSTRGCVPPCDIPSRCCFFTGPWTVTRSPLRMLRRVAAFCRPLRPVLLLVSFPRSRSPVVGVLGLCPPPRPLLFSGAPRACLAPGGMFILPKSE